MTAKFNLEVGDEIRIYGTAFKLSEFKLYHDKEPEAVFVPLSSLVEKTDVMWEDERGSSVGIRCPVCDTAPGLYCGVDFKVHAERFRKAV